MPNIIGKSRDDKQDNGGPTWLISVSDNYTNDEMNEVLDTIFAKVPRTMVGHVVVHRESITVTTLPSSG